jgi:putative nucleotidyltransferase with HDIG domain
MRTLADVTRRLKLRHAVFLLLVLSGAIPLAISNGLLIRQNRDLLETEEKSALTASAQALSRELGGYLASNRRELESLGEGILAPPGPTALEARLREPWVSTLLQRFSQSGRQPLALRVLGLEGVGWRFAAPDLGDAAETALDQAFIAAKDAKGAKDAGSAFYRFAVLPRGNSPVAALAVPIRDAGGRPAMVVEALVPLRLTETVFERQWRGTVQAFLIDRDGTLLWSEGASPSMQRALASSALVRDFVKMPLNLTAEYELRTERGSLGMLGMVSPVGESGWGVVVQKPAAAAFEAARRMVVGALLAVLLLLLLAILFALYASRWIGQPILALSETAHEIASGNFAERLEEERAVVEIADLSRDFNRMAGHVEDHVARLKEAAAQNRDLFISSIRAFAAAIDAKDPYTRGHSERVAELARSISKALGMNEDFQQKLWIGALLHDIGKIGIEDRILRKSGVLTPEEFEVMKTHPAVGAEILQPIELLRDMLPAVRCHHENWNGKGYPDRLRGESIPLMARIVAVADTFDAITTSRPYQAAYETKYAAELITQLAGSRFDAKVVTAFLRAFQGGALLHEIHETTRPGLEIELPIAANI